MLTPEQRGRVQGWADATWETGITFGTVGLRKGDHQLEITTYRSDVYGVESRKPEVEFGDSLVGDLRRRDFTIESPEIKGPPPNGRALSSSCPHDAST